VPTTFESVARQVVAALDSSAGYTLAFQWVIKRYEQVACRTRFSHLRQLALVTVAAPITTGTVSATRDSHTLTFDADATAEVTAAVIGRYIRLSVTWYEIGSYQLVGGFATLTLVSPYTEDDVTDGSYRIIDRFVSLATDASHISDTFINPRRRWGLKKRDLSILDREAPSRSAVAGTAQVVAEAPFDPHTGLRRVEFYPYSDTSETYYYLYWRAIGTFQLTDYVPPVIPIHTLIEGALVDLYRFKMGQSLDAGKLDIGTTWSNLAAKQETLWERRIVEMIAADRGEDDATFLVRRVNEISDQDIQTASQHIMAGWSWPT